MRDLRFGRAGAEKGQAVGMVVFLHGYGADGNDLLGLADPMAPHLPGVAFAAPDAPERCAGGGFGYQWFPIPWLDGSPQALAEAGLHSIVPPRRVGGNLDIRDLAAGTTLYLPVQLR